MSKDLRDMVWKEFERTGNAGMFMLYNALNEKDENKE